MRISYSFELAGGRQVQRFDIDVERPVAQADAGAPAWTRLDFRRCPNCPLPATPGAHCPAALDLVPVIKAFGPVISHERAQVVVSTPERVVGKDTQVQHALSSVVALVMATSGCPILSRMKGLARTHLPFASAEESLMRVAGAYLVSQYLVQQQGGRPDWSLDGLKRHYAELEVLNKAFKKRVDAAAGEDSTLNAVSALGVLSMGVGVSLEDQIAELGRYAVDGA